MTLRDYNFEPSYNRIDNDIAGEFYLPCMRSACRYDRIAGYFSSTVYVVAWEALKDFLGNGGKIRIICSPAISEEDQEALIEGSDAQKDEMLSRQMEDELEGMLRDEYLNLTARLLTCLIANGTITMKIAVPKKNGHPDIKNIYHDKAGIFYDSEGNRVGFRGTFNETYKGLSNDGNIESVDVFQDMEDGTDEKDRERTEKIADLFERIWNNRVADSVYVCDIPQAVRDRIFEQGRKENYNELMEEIQVQDVQKKEKKWMPSPEGKVPRKHQVEALDNWLTNGRRGILKHATGSGKTFTAICAINDSLKRGETSLVLVPTKELLYQWKRELKDSIPDKSVQYLLCGDQNNTWKKNNYLKSWTRENVSIKRIIIATMATASSEEFLSCVSGGDHLFIVADEVHNLGSNKRRNVFRIKSGPRLGLSATPERYGDPDGTQAIFDYFGPVIQPEYTLKNAIDDGVLTPYFYYPEMVSLTESEQEEWNEISRQISTVYAQSGAEQKSASEIMKSSPRLRQLLIRRARILKNAENKCALAIRILKDNFEQGQKWLVYCDNEKQMKQVCNAAEDAGFEAFVYYAGMKGDRGNTLDYFSREGGVLVSIKCLDEGVDIPSATHALILASSQNPREFIQRRGRILRRSPDKAVAHLYDAVTLPFGTVGENDRKGNIIVEELSRAIQFGNWARNPTCISKLYRMALDYGIDYEEYFDGGFEEDEDE